MAVTEPEDQMSSAPTDAPSGQPTPDLSPVPGSDAPSAAAIAADGQGAATLAAIAEAEAGADEAARDSATTHTSEMVDPATVKPCTVQRDHSAPRVRHMDATRNRGLQLKPLRAGRPGL